VPELEIERAVVLFPPDEAGHDHSRALFSAAVHALKLRLAGEMRPGKRVATRDARRLAPAGRNRIREAIELLKIPEIFTFRTAFLRPFVGGAELRSGARSRYTRGPFRGENRGPEVTRASF
jgi:hypothetical protein